MGHKIKLRGCEKKALEIKPHEKFRGEMSLCGGTAEHLKHDKQPQRHYSDFLLGSLAKSVSVLKFNL